MIQKDLGVSGTYLLCKGNRIHKFRIKWCSKSKPTVEQRHEVMRITEDIIKSNNLPQRITTGQLKITTKISLWSPRSKALSLRQFRSEKQGHLSAHKHSYVLRVSLADSRERRQGCENLPTFSSVHSADGWENGLQPFNPERKVVETVANDTEFVQMDGMQLNTKDTGCENLPTFSSVHSADGWENGLQPFNPERKVVETVVNDTEFVQMDGMQLNTKDTDAVIHEDKPLCQNQADTKESVEVMLDRYVGEKNFVRTSETEDIVSRIEKLVERACMAAKAYQNQAEIVVHDSEQDASKTATHGMKTEVVDCSGATGPTIELHHDLESEPKENFFKSSSFPITDASTVCQDEIMFTHDRWVKHPSSPKKLDGAHLQVVTAHWKFGNTKVSTNRNFEMFNIRKADIERHCSVCNVHIPKLPGESKEDNILAKPQACEIPLTVSSYSTLTHSTVAQKIRRKRCQKQNESEICELPKKKRVVSGDISPVILGPTTFQEFSPYHKGVMSVYNALKTFKNIVGRAEGRNGIESNLINLDEKLENWLTYQSIISRLRAVSRINSDKELREILRYIIRNLRNRSANMAFAHQNNKLASFTPALWRNDAHSDLHIKRALIIRSEEKETEIPYLSKQSLQSTLHRIGADCYKNSSAIHIKSESQVYSTGNEQTSCVPSHSQEMRAFNKTVSMKQQPVEENNSLQATLHISRMCEPATDESTNVQKSKVESVNIENNQPLEAEMTEKLIHTVKENNLFKCIATSEIIPKDKEKYEVETNGVVQILNFGDDFSGIVEPRCSPAEEVHLGRVKRPVQVHYDEICIPSVSYYRSPHFSAKNSLKQKENIAHSCGPVLFKCDNALDTASDVSAQLQNNNELKMDEEFLTNFTPSRIADVSPKEILLNAAIKLASLKELHTIPSIRALRTTLIQQGVDKAIEQTKLSSSVYQECPVPDVPSKLKSRTHTSVSSNFSTLGRVQPTLNRNVVFTSNTVKCKLSNTAESLSEMNSSVTEGSGNYDCNDINCSQNCRLHSFHRKTSSEKIDPPHSILPSIPHETIKTAEPVRVNVGKLLSCSKMQVFFTTELNVVDADCPARVSDCKLHSMSLKSQTSTNGEGDLITSLLHLVAFNASQNAFSTLNSQSSMADESLKYNISERKKLHGVPANKCVVNSSKMSQSHAYNFLKCTCFSVETTESISSTLHHCKCPPSIKFQGVSASCTVMSSQKNRTTPRRQLIDMIHNIKSNVKDRKNICDGQHCFYFHVDKEESVEGFYSTVEKYCSALSKFHSHQYNSSRSIEILLRDIWLPGHKHSISFYVNLPLQKYKCSYCGLDKPAELCLNCGELFECTELGNYVPFDTQKTPEYLDMKIEISDAAVKVLNLVNDLYLCKPVVIVQETDISMYKQKKSSVRRTKKPKHLRCNI